MKTECPHCNTVQKAPDEATGREALCKSCREKFTISQHAPPFIVPVAALPNPDDIPITVDADDQPSHRAVMVLIAIIGIAAGGTTGFFCGAILTRPNRQKVNAEIAAIQDAADAGRLAAEELRTKNAELVKTGGQLIFENAMLSAQLDSRTEQIAALTTPPPGGIIHLEEKSDRPPRFISSGVRIVESYRDGGCHIVGQLTSTTRTYRGASLFNLSVFDRQKRLLDVAMFSVSALTKQTPMPFFLEIGAASADIYYYQVTPYGL